MSTPAVVCVGHVCLDLTPELPSPRLPRPGELLHAGPAVLEPGGSVGNTGLALARLGLPTRLVARVGDDAFGRVLQDRLNDAGVREADLPEVAPGDHTSYSVVFSPQGTDRSFLHCPGANDRFDPDTVPDARLAGASVVHLGYPPAMRRCAEDGGAAVRRLFERARQAGARTTLDFCGIDPHGWAAAIDWPAWLDRVLPVTDVFLPSRDELAAALGTPEPGPAEVLGRGCAALVIKDGVQGLHLHCGPDAAARLGPAWRDADHDAPTFDVPVGGTTGAGDVTIAGFLAGLARHAQPRGCTDLACAAGALSVRGTGPLTDLPDLAGLEAFLAQAPPRRQPRPQP